MLRGDRTPSVMAGQREAASSGKCLHSTASLDQSEHSSHHRLKNGHTGIFTQVSTAKIDGLTSVKAAYTPPRLVGVRLTGSRKELLEKELFTKISEQTHAELNPAAPATDFCSTTRADYTVEGFNSVIPLPSKNHDYKTEQAITFWSENHRHVQGMTAVTTSDTPFRKNAFFSTPISEQLDDPMHHFSRNVPSMCTAGNLNMQID
ncbi:sperm-associated antigen 8 [Denticeps clupeoides]|uniref:sperm-associated antigen 8 n=1 Tax=Denticeps clupeoides TaxID=299321 RepID=UPI0010A4FC0E|nr:sperm-associated antigen 8-like [Denticeps clupeoides]